MKFKAIKATKIIGVYSTPAYGSVKDTIYWKISDVISDQVLRIRLIIIEEIG